MWHFTWHFTSTPHHNYTSNPVMYSHEVKAQEIFVRGAFFIHHHKHTHKTTLSFIHHHKHTHETTPSFIHHHKHPNIQTTTPSTITNTSIKQQHLLLYSCWFLHPSSHPHPPTTVLLYSFWFRYPQSQPHPYNNTNHCLAA